MIRDTGERLDDYGRDVQLVVTTALQNQIASNGCSWQI